ncbi:ABC transporter permease [Micromonospora sp. LHW51205]|uniref:ABC transporter permease n=1 Tax=Micromonospora sp. LHW51205 TaxID=2248752 RepID=UPI000DEB18A4|nr:ABC transporter permease [Micromonospora sp. LHW51205]RBQ03884.1 ABC transporter permease [Micromonospora sp. LHW51205]
MTAPTINGTRYPQPIEDLLPAARALDLPEGEAFPSRNRLMREFRIGAPKAGELLALLKAEPATPPIDSTSPDATDPADAPAVPEPAPPVEPDPTPAPEITTAEPDAEATPVSRPDTPTADEPGRRPVVWPVVLMALGAFVAVWSGWVGLGKLTGFGKVDLLPGIVEPGSWATIDSAITLPIGVEAYAAYALYVWLSGRVPTRARTFAKWSALASLAVGALGQVAYHLLTAYDVTAAPWWITTLVSCLPVAVLGMGAALAHLVREGH